MGEEKNNVRQNIDCSDMVATYVAVCIYTSLFADSRSYGTAVAPTSMIAD